MSNLRFSNLTQNKFEDIPLVLVTAEHVRTGKEYDASLIWTEDPNKDSFNVCLREMQNFDGKHEDITVVCSRFNVSKILFLKKLNIKWWNMIVPLSVVRGWVFSLSRFSYRWSVSRRVYSDSGLVQTPYFSCAEPNWISSTLERHWRDIWFRRRTVCRT